MPTFSTATIRSLSLAATAVAASLALAACGSGSSGGGGAAAPSGSAASSAGAVTLVKPGQLTVCTHMSYKPFQFKKDAQIVGFDVDLVDGGLQFGTAVAAVDRETLAATTGKKTTIGVRPEDLVVATSGEGLQVEVDVVEELGADGYLYGHTEVDGKRVDVVARVDGRSHPNAGDRIVVTPAPEHVHVFDAESGERLSAKPVES